LGGVYLSDIDVDQGAGLFGFVGFGVGRLGLVGRGVGSGSVGFWVGRFVLVGRRVLVGLAVFVGFLVGLGFETPPDPVTSEGVPLGFGAAALLTNTGPAVEEGSLTITVVVVGTGVRLGDKVAVCSPLPPPGKWLVGWL
jgi:hypothetical protein